MADKRLHTFWMNDPRNLTIALLVVVVALLGGRMSLDHVPGALGRVQTTAATGEPVAVLDVVLDREGLRYVDVLLDRPVGEQRVGEILGLDAATVRPAVGGTWRWEGASVLRFEPAGGFGMAMRYEFALVGDRILPPGRTLTGQTSFELVTDQFQVERVDTFQEPTPEGDAVQIRGTARFNYPVDPEMLAGRLALIDPVRGEVDPVPLSFETYWPDRVIAFRSEPLSKERNARDLTLRIERALTPADGNVSLTTDFDETITLGSSETLAVWDVMPEPGDPESRLRVRLSSPVDASAAGRFITVEPAGEFRVTASRNELVLVGDFQPGTELALRIESGMSARDGARLDEEYSTSLRIPDLESTVDFEGQGMFLSSAGSRALAIESVNTDAADLVVERVFRNNLFYLFNSYAWMVWDSESYAGSQIAHALGDRVVERSLRVGGPPNRRQRHALQLGELVDTDAPGLYRIMLARRGDYRAQQRWVMVTDLGVVAKQGESDFLVWVSSFSSLRPVGGARVTLVSDQNQPIATGTTDASGVWRFRDAAGLTEARPYLVLVERGDDFSFLLLDGMQIDTTGLDVGGGVRSAGGYQAFMYGERDIYRPGEVAHGVALLRDRELEAPPPMPLTLRHLDPAGLERSTVRATADAAGTVPFDLELPDYSRTGRHSLELRAGDAVVGRYGFQVEEFVPDRIRVEIDAPDTRLGPGDELAFGVVSNYLFGPPAADLAVETRVRLEPEVFTAEGFGEFSFRDPERTFPGQEILSTDGRLDQTGRLTGTVELPAGLRVPSSLAAVIVSRVREEGGRGVAARRRVPVHPYPYYVGIRRGAGGYAEPGTPERFEYVAVDPAGQRREAGALRVQLFKDEWQTVLRRTPAGTFRYESTRDTRLVDSFDLPSGTDGGSFELTPPEFGAFRAVITDPLAGPSSQVSFSASGAGFSPWAIDNPARIELELDREEYRPGDVATVQVRAPFAGRLLLTVEREGVEAVQVHDLTGNTATLSVPIRDSFRPNAYITATIVRAAGDLQPGAVGRAFGAAPVAVDRASNRLDVAVAAAEEIRPETELEISVTTEPGARLTVAAVDEGILQLINQPVPDPFEFFYRKLALGVSSFDTFSLLFPEVGFGTEAVGGGAAADAMTQFVRTEGIRRVRPVALWSGSVQADASGVAIVRFDVPEFQGALRVMAVAHTGRRFGSASASVRVRDPLVLLPTLPRFLAPGDRVSLPVAVRNDTGADADVDVRLSVSLPGNVEVSADESARVAEGDREVLYFELDAGAQLGPATVEIAATGNGESTSVTAELPVRADLPAVTREETGAMQQAGLEIAAAEGFRPGGTRSLRIGRTPTLQFSGRLEDLLRYPYGCLEQVTSTAFPLLYLGAMADEFDPELFGAGGGPTVQVQEAIRRIGGFQTYSGGFTLWQGSNELQPWASVYATHFLVEARLAGFLVTDALYGRAITFLHDEVRAQGEYSRDELQRVAYALYVLARAGDPDPGTMDFLRERHITQMSPESRALLGAAYAATGNPAGVEEMIVGLRQVEELNRQTGGNFNSPVRNRALVLLSLLDAAPEDSRVAPLARRLARDAAAAGPWSTQETAFALLALGRFYGGQAASGEFSGRVLVDGEVVAEFDTGTHEFIDLSADAALRIELDPGYTPGGVYYTVRTRGVPTDLEYSAVQQGLQVRRVFLDRRGNPIDLAEVRQGELLVVRMQVRSSSGPVDNVVLQNLLPAGLEVENPRLSGSEGLPWIGDADLAADHLDLRDDRILLFTSLPDARWRTAYALVRAVTPGRFRVPPIQAEAMYEPALRAASGRDVMEVSRR